jgi:predicted  nucleic acid-binding Zn-ribbon protein
MARDTAISPNLDRLLGEYRAGTKAWGLRAMTALVAAVLIGLFFVLPVIEWSDRKKGLEAEMGQVTAKRKKTEDLIRGLRSLEDAFNVEKRRMETDGQALARELSERLSTFARAVQGARSGSSRMVVDSEGRTFPGASMAEQFARPSPGQGEASPREVLKAEYQLSDDGIALITTAAPGTPEWDKGVEVTRAVYLQEIDRIYRQLNDRVVEAFSALRGKTEKTLSGLKPQAEELGMLLPSADSIVAEAPKIERPADDRLFQTRQSKMEALGRETGMVNVNLDAAMRPIQAVHGRLMASAKHLDQGLNDLKVKQEEAEKTYQDLEKQAKDVVKQLSQFSIPLDWIPLAMGIETLVLCFPPFFAVVFFLLAGRFLRLHTLAERLRSECRTQGIAEHETELALYTPQTIYAWLADSRGAEGSRSMLFPMIFSLLVFSFPVAVAISIARSLSFGSPVAWFLLAGTAGIGMLGCSLVYRFLSARGSREVHLSEKGTFNK